MSVLEDSGTFWYSSDKSEILDQIIWDYDIANVDRCNYNPQVIIHDVKVVGYS